jgi:hypothetical protein
MKNKLDFNIDDYENEILWIVLGFFWSRGFDKL